MLEGIVWINNGPIIALYQLAFKTCQVSETIEHDTTNALFYLCPVLNKNKMYIHFYIEEFNEEYISLKHEASVYLDWHKDFFRNSLHFILKLIILLFWQNIQRFKEFNLLVMELIASKKFSWMKLRFGVELWAVLEFYRKRRRYIWVVTAGILTSKWEISNFPLTLYNFDNKNE